MTHLSSISYKESAAIREALKAAFPEFRFSVTKSGDNSVVHVRIMSGPVDLDSLVSSCRNMISSNVKQVDFGYFEDHHYASYVIQLTPEQFEEHQDLFNAIIDVIQRSFRSNMSDQSKEFQRDRLIKYTLGIGKYQQPYQIRYPRKGLYHLPMSYAQQARTALAFTELAA
jgi:hypothetical protein